MDTSNELRLLLDDTLNMDGRAQSFIMATSLLGSMPEMDSMGVVSILTAIEERFGFSIDDDEIDGQVFATFGSLLEFVQQKVSR